MNYYFLLPLLLFLSLPFHHGSSIADEQILDTSQLNLIHRIHWQTMWSITISHRPPSQRPLHHSLDCSYRRKVPQTSHHQQRFIDPPPAVAGWRYGWIRVESWVNQGQNMEDLGSTKTYQILITPSPKTLRTMPAKQLVQILGDPLEVFSLTSLKSPDQLSPL